MKPKFLLWLIHFVLFQNAFELASFFWFWWQFGNDSCFIKNHQLVYCRLVLGFAGQFLCSYSTLPVYSLVTQGFDLRILTKEEDCRGRPVLGRAVGRAQTRACQLWAGTRKGDVLGRWPSWAVVSRCGRWQKPLLFLREGPAGAAASAERQGAMPELLEAGDGRRGRSRPSYALLLQAPPPLLLEAPPPLLMEQTWPAGGGHRLEVDGRRACRPSSGAGHGRIFSA